MNSSISHESDHDSNMSDQLFWAATFNRVIGANANRDNEEEIATAHSLQERNQSSEFY